MLGVDARCDGAFIGHAIASDYDSSIFMAVNISESLLEHGQFNGPDILSRHLYLYHTQKCEVGGITKYVYQLASNIIKSNDRKQSISRQDFLFDQSAITEFVRTTDSKLGGQTTGCSPAHRSFPLALCTWIDDNDLFYESKKEAALTHHHAIAGQVAGIVNLICRSLLRNNEWHEAVNSAFLMGGLHPDVINVSVRYTRSATALSKFEPAYAPAALNAALYCVSHAKNVMEAIQLAREREQSHYCAPIVGILAGMRWGVPLDVYKKQDNDTRFRTICDIASQLSNQWLPKKDTLSS